MSKYQKGKIYKIISDKTDKCYIGSTIQSLSKRLSIHWSDFKRNKRIASAKILALGDARIELVENYPCDNKQELLKREGYWMQRLDCVNKRVAGRTRKEFRNQNKERLRDEQKQYRKQNPDVVKNRKKRYYDQNRDEILERRKTKVTCECGSVVRRECMVRHKRTQKHLDWVTQQNTKPKPKIKIKIKVSIKST